MVARQELVRAAAALLLNNEKKSKNVNHFTVLRKKNGYIEYVINKNIVNVV